MRALWALVLGLGLMLELGPAAAWAKGPADPETKKVNSSLPLSSRPSAMLPTLPLQLLNLWRQRMRLWLPHSGAKRSLQAQSPSPSGPRPLLSQPHITNSHIAVGSTAQRGGWAPWNWNWKRTLENVNSALCTVILPSGCSGLHIR